MIDIIWAVIPICISLISILICTISFIRLNKAEKILNERKSKIYNINSRVYHEENDIKKVNLKKDYLKVIGGEFAIKRTGDPLNYMEAVRVEGYLIDIIYLHKKNEPDDIVFGVYDSEATRMIPIVFKTDADLKFYMSFFTDNEKEEVEIIRTKASYFNEGAVLLKRKKRSNNLKEGVEYVKC